MTPARTAPGTGTGTATGTGHATGARSGGTDPRLDAVHQRLLEAVRDLTDGQGWQHMLRTAAALPTYSPHNVLLITQQHPTARAVAGFHTWRSLGRTVRKGEKGIAILAPVLHRQQAAAPGDTKRPAGSGPPNAAPTVLSPRRLAGFRVVYVFDISQTNGPDLPDPSPVLLDGQAPAGLLDGLTAHIHAQGFQLLRHNFDVPHPGQGSPNGVTDYFARTVIVRPDLTPAQTSKTLAHELGHVLLHRPKRPTTLTREQAEVEAESVAYVVTAAHGLDSSAYTIPYVAGWSAGDTELVARTADRVLRTARNILSVTPPPPALQLDDTTREHLRTPHKTPPSADRSVASATRGRSTPPHRPAPSWPPPASTTPPSAPGPQPADQGRLW